MKKKFEIKKNKTLKHFMNNIIFNILQIMNYKKIKIQYKK